MEGDLATLCRSCGMCCDGSLFGLVDLESAEVEPARRRRLRVLDSRKGFEQPCSALTAVETTRDAWQTCSIYAERPLACRRFACRLYDRHQREGGPLEPRLAAVRRIRELVASLDALGSKPADFEAEPSTTSSSLGSFATQTFAELMRRLEEDFARA
jgi:hypothetical protein